MRVIEGMDNELTILLMTYNRFIYTKYCLRALLEYTDFSCVKEVLIGDAGSTDGTWKELIEPYDRMGERDQTLLKTYQVPYGSVANNIRTGAGLATGKYILILGNDILVSQDWNRKALAAIRAGQEHGIRIVCYDMPDGDLYDAVHGNVRRFVPNAIPHNARGPINCGDFKLQPTWQAGGLWITSRDLLLSRNGFGELGQVAEGQVYFGWWFWHLGFQNQIAVLQPRLATYMMELGDQLPSGCEYMRPRLDEPLVKELLAEDPVALKQEYLRKGWMRDFKYK